ncbi:MAG: hypothetical protein KDA28_01915 [Phycisphaerales bacterium]|nr:hypothetical protein [Phycisphaerales bacterium]
MTWKRIIWPIWSLVPVVALAIHFGPGQLAMTEARARRAFEQALELEVVAQAAQDEAHALHLAWLDARREAVESAEPASAQRAREAADDADRAYARASAAWLDASTQFAEAQDQWKDLDDTQTTLARIARNRTLIRAGEITSGVRDLEAWLAEAIDRGDGETDLARQARTEIASGYYFGARLMRQAGKPTEEWMTVASLARQNFRYLAEGTTGEAREALDDAQKNLELALDLEHASDEVQWKPRPRNSPQKGNTEGLDGQDGRGKTRRPPRRRGDARGAGGVGDIPPGW